METRQVTKNGQTVTYGIEGDHVVLLDADGKVSRRISMTKMPPGEQTEGFDEFRNCMKGCYDLKKGSPWDFAACVALCATLLG